MLLVQQEREASEAELTRRVRIETTAVSTYSASDVELSLMDVQAVEKRMKEEVEHAHMELFALQARFERVRQ